MVFGFVCTNYKNSGYTVEAVRSLLRNDEQEFRVIVVDNHSDQENVETLKGLSREFENVELILSRENVGYFRGLNLGIRRLRLSQPDLKIMVVGNNDLVFQADFAESLRRNSSLFEKYPVVCPDIVTLDGVHQNPYVIKRISKFRECVYDVHYANYYLALAIRRMAKWTSSFTARSDQNQYEVAREIHWGLGACYVLGPMFFSHFEELWAPTFLVHEEYFLSKQLRDKGMCMYYEPSIRVLHHFQVSMGALADRKAWEFGRDAHRIRRQYVKTFD